MAWQDTLLELREELAEARADRLQRASEEAAEIGKQRDELTQLAASLGISDVLSDMNRTLLDGKGELETIVSWEPGEQDDDPSPDDDEDEEEADGISAFLTWEEGEEREIAVDLGLAEDGIYLQVNGVDIRREREALEVALIEAFRDELDI
ncbi:MAG: hypothetical protein J4O03_00225 [Chloroflexi bacterium]|nr:hypothetical protein [Chloroflexota bacterium]MCI0779747.1 hypothetical protein [Chloroflexota bacterium]MCI0785139.1 hypothetical protein [Chloroflexota bacterium]MCI0791863.1 hypothetical protein [Chloroflexota bacterium]MCI0797616.1 hypothetical protein [Chloroflexota bacterium]